LALLAASFALIGGGAWLVWLGGSPYFLLIGFVLGASALLVFARDALGAATYALAFLATILWSAWEVGPAFWPLMSRLYAPAILLFLVAAAAPLLDRGRWRIPPRYAFAAAALVGLGLVAASAGMFRWHDTIQTGTDIGITPVAAGTEQREWRHYANGTDGRRFAALDRIDRGNVARLRVAWIYKPIARATRDYPHNDNQNTPIQVGDTLYLCAPPNMVFAVDIDSGRERWRFDPQARIHNWGRCRGLGYHGPAATLSQPAAPGAPPCESRLFVTTLDARLIALDARTGRPCAEFGDSGTIDLTANMGPVTLGQYGNSSAPLVAGDRVVVGSRVADYHSPDMPGGVVRAFDARSGDLAWAFDSGNPAITREPPPGKTYTRGTPNTWPTMAYDQRLGLVFLPVGNPSADAWGGDRRSSDEAYIDSIVALDAATGRERWKFQTVHRDLWNYDLPGQPILDDLPDGRGGTIPALIQTTKTGQVFVLDRATGRPIARVEERRVPQGVVPGGRLSLTQPFSVGMPMLAGDILEESDAWGLTPFDQLYCRIAFRRLRYDGIFTPPGTDRALSFPGPYGGMNWGSAALDPLNDRLVVTDTRLAYTTELVPRRMADRPGTEQDNDLPGPMTGSPFGYLRNPFLSPLNLPCHAPPFGRMTAIDLGTGRLAWQTPIGTLSHSGPGRWRSGLPIALSTDIVGGPMITQSGLVFVAGTRDYFLRAFDLASGKELWKGELPIGAQAVPMTYKSARTGRQYVVVSAGGIRSSPDRGNYVVAFALP
jgi:quinate dehydrogenase (quinone)